MKPIATATRTARPGWRRPVVQFVAVGLLMAVILAIVTGWLSERAARDEAIRTAQATTELLARSVVEPALTTGLIGEDAADIDQFDRLMTSRVATGEILRVKLWDSAETIVYSDEPRLIGEHFDLEQDQLDVLEGGGTEAEVSDLARSENKFEQPLGRVLEVYTRVEDPGGKPLLFEAYFSYDDVAQRTDRVLGAFRPITVGGILLFLALTVPLVWLLARRLDVAAADRERLLVVAAQASDAERRRIARDLHDGVVQDLAGTSFALSATAREVSVDPQSPEGTTSRVELATSLNSLAASVRRSLRSLRSLLVEIYPPDLSSAVLPAALDDLLAPAVASGLEVTLEVPDTADWPEDVVALVWRTAQEAVRNAMRHGQPRQLDVRLSRGDGDRAQVRLEVTDDGRGFDPSAPGDDDRFGLRGLRDLAVEAGGTLDVTSAPGAGTTIVLTVPTR